MPIVKSLSAEEPDRILMVNDGGWSHIWLRKNITKDTEDNGPDGKPFDFYRADEVSFVAPYMTREEVEQRFDELWTQYAYEEEPISDRISTLENAVVELADMLGGA